jgi:MFS family permease
MTDDAPYPSVARGWALTLLLTLAYVLSYIDRSILGALVQPIKADFGVSDWQMGLLSGLAFVAFYGTIGVPLGWLADRYRRTHIVAGGVTVWSLATVLSGLARGYGQLFTARMTVGIGEATLSPFAAGLSGLIGAAVLAAGKDGMVLPLIGAVKPWQFAFIAVGLPGLILGPLFLLVPEPPRRTTETTPVRFGEAFREIGRHPLAFGGVGLLAAVMTTIAYAGFFNVVAFSQTFGWTPQRYLAVNGAIQLILGPFVVFAFGWLIDILRSRGVRDAAFRVLAAAFVPMLPLTAVGLFMPDPWLALVVMSAGGVCVGAITSSAILALLDITPARVRGQIVAIYYMVISIAGLGLGPTTAGFLSTVVFGEDRLRWAVGAVPILYGLVPLLILPLIGRAYRRRLAENA